MQNKRLMVSRINTTTLLPAPVRQGAGRLFQWWSGELAACLPPRVRATLWRSRQRLVVEISDTRATFAHGKAKSVRRLGSVTLAPGGQDEGRAAAQYRDAVERIVGGVNLGSLDVVLRLPREKVLRRVVELPVAASENLREVLGFEMDRHTPFKAQEVYYDFRIKDSDQRRKRIKVDLVVVPKAVVDRVIRMAGAWGLDPDRLEVAGGGEATDRPFDLLPRSAAKSRRTTSRRLAVALGVLAGVLLVAGAYIPLEGKRRLLETTEAQLARARTQAAQVDAMKTRLEELIERNRFAVERKRIRPTVTEVLDEVTRRLPDHTWVLKFVVRDRRVILSGYSAKPSALIGLLEESQMFSGVRFSSPVTMDQRVGLERFNLTASVTERNKS